MDRLQEYLTQQLGRAYRQLNRSLEGLSETDALSGADPEWRRYRYGTGLDGSIAGIVHHVAAWKHVAADGLEGGSFPDAEVVLPHGPGWAGLREWLDAGHARLVRVLDENAGTPAWLEREVVWEGIAMSIATVLTHALEHDHYHAGQVNLLRQQWGHLLAD